MKILRNIVAIQIAMMVVLTSGGLTIFLNLCGCTQVTTISVLSNSSSCCGMASTYDAETYHHDTNILSEEGCCKTLISYQKLGETVTPATIAPLFSTAVTILPSFSPAEPISRTVATWYVEPPPLLRSGRQLILFLSNPKILSELKG